MDKKFDWHSEPLSPSTVVTSSYKNTQNVRRFFRKYIGEHFHFTRPFMKYLLDHTGITLEEAVKEWKRQYE